MVTKICSIKAWEKWKLSEDSRVKSEGNQVCQVMIKFISNDEVDKLKLSNDEVDKKKKA